MWRDCITSTYEHFIMIAITLAAGRGTRMEDLCLDKPKVMIEFLGKSLLQRQNGLFKRKNIAHYIVGGHKRSAIKFPENYIRENQNFAVSNMVYSLLCAKDVFKENEDAIISYGDIIFQEDVLEKLLNESDGDIQICADKNFLSLWSARMDNPLEDLESFCVNEKSGYITEIGKKLEDKAGTYAQYIGLFKIKYYFVDRFFSLYEQLLKENMKYQYLAMTHFLQILINNGAKIKPVYIEAGWLEFDTKRDFDTYILMHREGRLRDYYVDR